AIAMEGRLHTWRADGDEIVLPPLPRGDALDLRAFDGQRDEHVEGMERCRRSLFEDAVDRLEPITLGIDFQHGAMRITADDLIGIAAPMRRERIDASVHKLAQRFGDAAR